MIEVPAPCQSDFLIGHDEAAQAIHSAYDARRMPHAWLLTGREGIGKATLATHIAHLVLSGGANRIGKIDPSHPAARLIMARSHHDLFILERPADEKTGVLKETIPVETTRKIEAFFRQTSAHGYGRVALIDEAHTLGRFGQNAILKIIEEPPRGGVVVLTASSAGALLPTIRSRCRHLALDGLSARELETVLTRLGLALPQGGGLLNYADGSVGRALLLMQTESLPLLDRLVELLAAGELDKTALYALADMIGKKADQETFDILTSLLTDFLRLAITHVAKGQGDPTGLVTRLAGEQGRLDRALDRLEAVQNSFRAAKASNLDNKLVFINAITALAQP